jgi:hypothetical protein
MYHYSYGLIPTSKPNFAHLNFITGYQKTAL